VLLIKQCFKPKKHYFFFACFVASKLPTDPQLHPGSEPFGAAPCASLAALRGVAAAPWWRVTGMEWWGWGDVPPKPSKYVNMYYIQLYIYITGTLFNDI
jgi:hypothetical protein